MKPAATAKTAKKAAKTATKTATTVKPAGAATGARAQAKQETREALIDAGLALIAEQGIDGPSLDAICERAGKTRGAFYVHFEDRDAFLVAAMDRVGKQFLDVVLAAGEGGEAGEGDLEAVVARFVAAVVSGEYPLTGEGGVKPHQLLDACARSPKIRARYVALVEECLTRLGATVRAGQKRARLRRDVDAGEVATLLMAAVIGAQTMMELKVPIEPATLAATLMRVLAP